MPTIRFTAFQHSVTEVSSLMTAQSTACVLAFVAINTSLPYNSQMADFDIPLTRGLIDFGIFLSAVFLVAFALLAYFFVTNDWESKSEKDKDAYRELYLRRLERGAVDRGGGGPDSAGCITLLMCIIFPVVGVAIIDAGIHSLEQFHPNLGRTLIGTILIVFMSLSLFLLRDKMPIVYGGLEIAFAAGLAMSTMYFDLHDVIPAHDSFKLGTAAYLFVRGFDNLKKGLDKRKEENIKAKRPAVSIAS